MDSLPSKELKVKLDCFKNLPQTELFRNMDESIGTLSSGQVSFMNSYALVCGNVRGNTPELIPMGQVGQMGQMGQR